MLLTGPEPLLIGDPFLTIPWIRRSAHEEAGALRLAFNGTLEV